MLSIPARPVSATAQLLPAAADGPPAAPRPKGVEALKNSAPDGQTLTVMPCGPLLTHVHLFVDLRVDAAPGVMHEICAKCVACAAVSIELA